MGIGIDFTYLTRHGALANTAKSNNLRQSRRLDFVNRSKRFIFGATQSGYLLNIVSWSIRWSSWSCFFMYSRICFSSRPTVETKYPLAQKLSPVKFLGFPRKLRAMWIALFPFMYPTTWDTEYFGGIDTSICTWSRIKCPSSIRLSRCIANCLSISPNRWRRTPYKAFLRYLGINTMWYLHSHLVWLKLSFSFTISLLSV